MKATISPSTNPAYERELTEAQLASLDAAWERDFTEDFEAPYLVEAREFWRLRKLAEAEQLKKPPAEPQ